MWAHVEECGVCDEDLCPDCTIYVLWNCMWVPLCFECEAHWHHDCYDCDYSDYPPSDQTLVARPVIQVDLQFEDGAREFIEALPSELLVVLRARSTRLISSDILVLPSRIVDEKDTFSNQQINDMSTIQVVHGGPS